MKLCRGVWFVDYLDDRGCDKKKGPGISGPLFFIWYNDYFILGMQLLSFIESGDSQACIVCSVIVYLALPEAIPEVQEIVVVTRVLLLSNGQ